MLAARHLGAALLLGLLTLTGCQAIDEVLYDHDLEPTTAGALDEVELEAGETVWLIVGSDAPEGVHAAGVSIKLRGRIERVDAESEPIAFDVWTMEARHDIVEGLFDSRPSHHRFDLDKADWVVYALHEIEVEESGTYRIELDEVEFRSEARAPVWIGFATLEFETGAILGLFLPLLLLCIGGVYFLVQAIARARGPKYW